jgi:hypothetical protein
MGRVKGVKDMIDGIEKIKIKKTGIMVVMISKVEMLGWLEYLRLKEKKKGIKDKREIKV